MLLNRLTQNQKQRNHNKAFSLAKRQKETNERCDAGTSEWSTGEHGTSLVDDRAGGRGARGLEARTSGLPWRWGTGRTGPSAASHLIAGTR